MKPGLGGSLLIPPNEIDLIPEDELLRKRDTNPFWTTGQ